MITRGLRLTCDETTIAQLRLSVVVSTPLPRQLQDRNPVDMIAILGGTIAMKLPLRLLILHAIRCRLRLAMMLFLLVAETFLPRLAPPMVGALR